MGAYCNIYFLLPSSSSSSISSTLCNHALVNYVGLSHRMAWLSTMIWIGVFNYFALKNVWRKDKLEGAPRPTGDKSGPGGDIKGNERELLLSSGEDDNVSSSSHIV